MEEIRGEYTIEDYLVANRLHLKESPLFRGQTIIFSIMSVLYIILIIANPREIFLWICLGICLLFSTYWFTILPKLIKHNYKIQKQMHGETIISIDSDCLCQKSERHESKFYWIYRYLSSNNMLIAYNTPKTFIIIPKRFCHDEEQFNRFVNLAKELSNK
jgi:hypothetical protein